MLKIANSMKSAELHAGLALRQLLEEVPIIKVEGIEHDAASTGWEPDLVARILVNGRPRVLVCDVKSNGQPRYARAALLQLRDSIQKHSSRVSPVFIAPFISPAVRRLCEEKNVNYLDLAGNARIAFDGVFIERVVTDKGANEQRQLKSIFSPKSAQVLRTMFRDPGRAWRVAELAAASHVSLGHVSNVRKGLIDQEWAMATHGGLMLSQPDALLDAWRDAYQSPRGERLRFYTPLHGKALEDAVHNVLGTQGGPGVAAFSSFSAAQWLAPYGRTGMHYFLADQDGLGKLKTALALTPAAHGENVIITVPNDDECLADVIEPAHGIVCTSVLQTYLDLSIAGERGAEAAEYLRNEKLEWPR